MQHLSHLLTPSVCLSVSLPYLCAPACIVGQKQRRHNKTQTRQAASTAAEAAAEAVAEAAVEATAEAAQHRQWGNEIEQRVEYTCAWQAHTLLMPFPLVLSPSLCPSLYITLSIHPPMPSFILLSLPSSLHPIILYNSLYKHL